MKIYLFMDGKLVPVRRQVDETRAVGRAALNALFEGPTAEESAASPPLTTSIPDGTILLGLDIADGLATVDLSRESKPVVLSASMFGRLAQVVYTLTQFPTVKQVAFQLDGEPVTVFSGEGIVLDEPSDREDYEAFLPSVFVDQPTWGATPPQPCPGPRHRERLRGRVLRRGARRRWRHARRGAGHGHLRHRVLGDVRRDHPVRRVAPAGGQRVTYHLSAMDGSIEDPRSVPGHARPVGTFHAIRVMPDRVTRGMNRGADGRGAVRSVTFSAHRGSPMDLINDARRLASIGTFFIVAGWVFVAYAIVAGVLWWIDLAQRPAFNFFEALAISLGASASRSSGRLRDRSGSATSCACSRCTSSAAPSKSAAA